MSRSSSDHTASPPTVEASLLEDRAIAWLLAILALEVDYGRYHYNEGCFYKYNSSVPSIITVS